MKFFLMIYCIGTIGLVLRVCWPAMVSSEEKIRDYSNSVTEKPPRTTPPALPDCTPEEWVAYLVELMLGASVLFILYKWWATW